MPPVLDLRHLQMAVALAETDRVGDAADRLGVTPSALSHRIREAERRLDVMLYSRHKRHLRMTPAAEHLTGVARRVLGELERAEADVKRMKRGVQAVVRFGIEAYNAYHWLPGFLTLFGREAAEIEVQVMADASRRPLAQLRDRAIDLALVSGRVEEGGIAEIPLFTDELLFVMAPDHRLAGQAFIEAEDLAEEDFITYSRIPAPDAEYARVMRPAGRYPRWTATVELPEAIVELVRAGLGTSVLTHWAVAPHLATGALAATRVTEAGLRIDWSLALREEDAEASPTRTLADALARWCGPDGRGLRGSER